MICPTASDQDAMHRNGAPWGWARVELLGSARFLFDRLLHVAYHDTPCFAEKYTHVGCSHRLIVPETVGGLRAYQVATVPPYQCGKYNDSQL